MVTLPRLGSVRGTTLRPTAAQGKSTRRMRTLPSCASSESSDAAASSEIPSRRPIWAGATGPCPASPPWGWRGATTVPAARARDFRRMRRWRSGSCRPHTQRRRRAPTISAGEYNDAMPMMTERDRAAVRKEFEKLTGPVKLVVFSQELLAGDLCRQNEALVREVAELSDQISVEVLNPAIDRERAAAYGVEQVPAIVVEGARDYGIRFYGVPTGYEFGNLIDSIVVVSTGQTALAEETLATLRTLTADVDIKVFSTPT